ncbi:MAG: 30S ribosomal protein S27e [Candidatus Diapherotrites archaeon]
MDEKKLIKKPKSKFLKIKCDKCSSTQTTFSAASTKVKCFKCSSMLAEPSGSKAGINGKILNEFKDY